MPDTDEFVLIRLRFLVVFILRLFAWCCNAVVHAHEHAVHDHDASLSYPGVVVGSILPATTPRSS